MGGGGGASTSELIIVFMCVARFELCFSVNERLLFGTQEVSFCAKKAGNDK